jgi:hypothetical protein
MHLTTYHINAGTSMSFIEGCRYHITYIATLLYLQLQLFIFNIVQQNSTYPDDGNPDRIVLSGKFVENLQTNVP